MRTGVIVVLLSIGLSFGAQSLLAYTPEEAAQHIGENGTVTGVIEDVHQAKGGNVFMNMGGRHPHETFTVFIPADKAKVFSNVDQYRGATVSVTGKIKDHQGKPEIIVNSPTQIAKGAGGSSAETKAGAAATPWPFKSTGAATNAPVAAAPAAPAPAVAAAPSSAAPAEPEASEPETITLSQPVQVKVKYGMTTLPAGITLNVIRRDANGIVVDYAGEQVTLPPK